VSRKPTADTRAVSPGELPDGAYRLLSIKEASAPTGSAGRDWFTYRIAQGPNMITGYRRGSLASVTEEVDNIVIGLNERRMVRRGRVDLTPTRQVAANKTPA
jgi:hypothetical protein